MLTSFHHEWMLQWTLNIDSKFSGRICGAFTQPNYLSFEDNMSFSSLIAFKTLFLSPVLFGFIKMSLSEGFGLFMFVTYLT